jgi:hypothetical protein
MSFLQALLVSGLSISHLVGKRYPSLVPRWITFLQMNGFSTGPTGNSPLGTDLSLLASKLLHACKLVSLIALEENTSPVGPQVNHLSNCTPSKLASVANFQVSVICN